MRKERKIEKLHLGIANMDWLKVREPQYSLAWIAEQMQQKINEIIERLNNDQPNKK